MKCVFCEISKGSLPSNIVRENDKFLAIVPKNIEVDGHLIVFPKKHYESIIDIEVDLVSKLPIFIKNTCIWLSEEFGFKGFNLLHASGEEAQQSIAHYHVHILPRMNKSEFNAWPELPGGKNIY